MCHSLALIQGIIFHILSHYTSSAQFAFAILNFPFHLGFLFLNYKQYFFIKKKVKLHCFKIDLENVLFFFSLNF